MLLLNACGIFLSAEFLDLEPREIVLQPGRPAYGLLRYARCGLSISHSSADCPGSRSGRCHERFALVRRFQWLAPSEF
jgi:hypothetical protein